MVIIEWGQRYLMEVWRLLLEMSPYLLLGFFIAGVLRLLIPSRILDKHLSGKGIGPIVKASLFGVPLPLCSCGVMPVAAHLRKEGASKSSIISFLTSTPSTGVDSILATYSLMGPLFAIFRPVVALVMGIVSGVAQMILSKDEDQTMKTSDPNECAICENHDEHTHGIMEKIKFVLHYAFVDLVSDITKWLVIGVLLGALITTFVPEGFLQSYLGGNFMSYLVMLVVGVPLYVCATGSIPIASSLISAGVSPGAALVFLIVGPATNVATISFVGGKLGRKSLMIYVVSIMVMAIISGIIFDNVWRLMGSDQSLIHGHMEMLPGWMKVVSAIFLSGIMIYGFISGRLHDHDHNEMEGGIIFHVDGMTCGHCKRKVESAIFGLDENAKVDVDLDKKIVKVSSISSYDDIKAAIELAGYEVK